MQERTIIERLESLEQTVAGLEDLPARVTAVEWQIVQLRGEMRDEFSAMRGEIRSGDDQTRREMHELNEQTRREMHELNEQTRREMHELNERTRAEMHALNAQTRLDLEAGHRELVALIAHVNDGLRSQMQALHEDLKSTISTMRELPPPSA